MLFPFVPFWAFFPPFIEGSGTFRKSSRGMQRCNLERILMGMHVTSSWYGIMHANTMHDTFIHYARHSHIMISHVLRSFLLKVRTHVRHINDSSMHDVVLIAFAASFCVSPKRRSYNRRCWYWWMIIFLSPFIHLKIQ